jgi:hypothetical protein
VIVLRREGLGGVMMIADMIGGMTGHGLRDGWNERKEDAGNVKKEDGYCVQRRDVGFVALTVFVTNVVMNVVMNGTEDTEN